MSEAWIGVIGAIVGVIATSTATLIGTFSTQRAQRREKIDQQMIVEQDRKRDAFLDFLLSSLRFYNHVVTLDLRELSGPGGHREKLQVLQELADPDIAGALDRSAVAVRLVTGGRLSKDVEAFTAKIVQDALSVAMNQPPEFGGYNSLSADMSRKLELELVIRER